MLKKEKNFSQEESDFIKYQRLEAIREEFTEVQLTDLGQEVLEQVLPIIKLLDSFETRKIEDLLKHPKEDNFKVHSTSTPEEIKQMIKRDKSRVFAVKALLEVLSVTIPETQQWSYFLKRICPEEEFVRQLYSETFNKE